MAYIQVDNFNAGMDRRRQRVAGAPGTMWDAVNVHVTRGGDIERRKKFVPQYHVPGTFGQIALRGQIYVFGSADLAASMPVGVLYQRLIAPTSPAMARILDARSFSGKIYAIAEYADGNVYHFYDGAQLTDWDVLAASQGSLENVATLMAAKIDDDAVVSATSSGATVRITSRVPGVAFTLAQSTSNGGVPDEAITLTQVQANIPAVAEVRASATIQITGGTAATGNDIASVNINGVTITSAALPWASTNAATAIRLATDISNGYGSFGYSATALGDTVTVQAAPGTGAAPNGFTLDVITTGNVTVVASGALAGGVAAVTAVAQVYTALFTGTFEINDQFTINVDGVAPYRVTGRASGTGRSLYIDKNRVWSPVASLENYCKLNDATVWNPVAVGSDAGFLNIASQTEGNEEIIVAARYQDLAAIFSSTEIVLYQLDQDPTKNAFQNVLENTGTRAAAAVVRYGNNDVFYLDFTGIRSLKARDASNAPFVSDVGNAIDTFVQSYLDGLTTQQVSSAIGAIEPRDGRLWMIAGARIFVLSYFPDAQITAWTYYDAEEFGGNDVQAISKVKTQLFVRAGDYVYCYGGLDGTVYPEDDEIIAQVQMPFLSGSTPATIKDLTGFDIAGTNVWQCDVAYDPNNADKTIAAGRFAEITFAEAGANTLPGRTSMVAPVFTCSKAGPATISMAAIHYELEKAD